MSTASSPSPEFISLLGRSRRLGAAQAITFTEYHFYTFKDADGNVIDTKEDSLDYISPNCYNFMIFTTKENAETVTLSLTPEIFAGKTASLAYDVDDSTENTLKIKVTNNGDNISSNTELTVIFVKNGKINGYSRGLSGKRTIDINPHSNLESTISDMPYDDYYIYLTGVAK